MKYAILIRLESSAPTYYSMWQWSKDEIVCNYAKEKQNPSTKHIYFMKVVKNFIQVLIWVEKALCNASLSRGHKCVILPITLAKC